MRLSTLRALVREPRRRTERECGEWLKAGKNARCLLPDHEVDTPLFHDSEISLAPGRVDLVVLAESRRMDNSKRRVAYVWELKAPQLYLFEPDGLNRVRPSQEFYSAENQLLHYYKHLRGYEAFRDKWDIIKTEEVRLGGIIIGRTDRLVKCPSKYSPEDMRRAALDALDGRVENLYGSRLQILTWDRVLERIPLKKHSHKLARP